MPTIFTGASRYSNDFQAVIDRAVAMASLPKVQLQQTRARMGEETKALREIRSALSSLADVAQALENSVTTELLGATCSDPSILAPAVKSGAFEGTYNLEVLSTGSYSTATAKLTGNPPGVNPSTADPQSGEYTTSSTLTLKITDKDGITDPFTANLTLAGKSLTDVVAAINAQTGGRLRATTVNVGSSTQPNYQLSVQSTTYGKFAIEISDGSNQLLDVDASQATHKSYGSRVEYVVNGATVKSDSRSITIAPGLTADLLRSAPGTQFTLSVEKSLSGFKAAMNRLAGAFNYASQILNNNTGANKPLESSSVAGSINSLLRQMQNTATPSGRYALPALLGLEFMKDGTLKFDETVFDREIRDKDTHEIFYDELIEFVGTTKTAGLAKNITEALDSLSKTKTGLMDSVISSMEASLKAQDAKIAAEDERIAKLQDNLQSRMMAADSTIAMLEQQVSYFNGMWDAMRTASKSYNG